MTDKFNGEYQIGKTTEVTKEDDDLLSEAFDFNAFDEDSKMHGGAGSGRYPKGSGNNEPKTSVKSSAPKLTEDEQRLLIEGLDSQEFAAEVEGRKEFDDCYNFGKKISEDNLGIGYYQGSGYHEINDYLRHPEKFADKTGTEVDTIAGYSAMVDEAFNEAPPIPEGTMLWRGVGTNTGEAISKMEIGDVCEDKGFQSYTIAPEVADRFGKTWFEDGAFDKPITPSDPLISHETIIRAVAGKGVKGIYGGLRGEYEMLVNRGTKWKVVGKEEIDLKNHLMRQPVRYHIITVVPE